MADSQDYIDMKSCRICLVKNKALCPLFRYKLSGNYAEMLTAIADVKVSSNDGLPEKICLKCCTTLEKAYLLKTVAERTDKKLRKMLANIKDSIPTKKIAFDSFTDIKSEIGPITIKSEPKWEMEIDVNNEGVSKVVETIDGKDIVIANTVIRKVDPSSEETRFGAPVEDDNVELTWKKTTSIKNDDFDDDFMNDDGFQDNVDDEDYIPPTEKQKTRFKKPKLSDIKVFKGKPIVRKIKVIKKIKEEYDASGMLSDSPKSTSITCYPILKNGTRGAPIILKRPKDSTILKVHTGYKPRTITSTGDVPRAIRREKPVRMVRGGVAKQREKLVCPVCGILTYTLGNHIATHQEKKRYTCPQCPRTFAQKSNLHTHAKQHSGIKDHICEICGAGFYSQKSLVRHNLIHKGERPYPCNLCNKRFIARCDLNRHLRIHSGYKPFKCGTCTMSFNAKHQLQNHERMHTGERPYSCQMQNLRRHMRSHTGDKPYTCDICGKSFVQKHHLQNHMLIHTRLKPYSCEVCNVAFSYKVNLNNHVFKVHGINLKFKSIHTVTEDILRRELGLNNETRVAISHIMPQLGGEVPPPAAHETVHHTSEY